MQEKVKILFYVKFACLKFLILNGFIIILIGQFTVDKDEWNTFINTMKTKLEENVFNLSIEWFYSLLYPHQNIGNTRNAEICHFRK
jgi:hypothetical protein